MIGLAAVVALAVAGSLVCRHLAGPNETPVSPTGFCVIAEIDLNAMAAR